MAERVTARMAAFIPGASPPEVRMPTHFICVISGVVCEIFYSDTNIDIFLHITIPAPEILNPCAGRFPLYSSLGDFQTAAASLSTTGSASWLTCPVAVTGSCLSSTKNSGII